MIRRAVAALLLLSVSIATPRWVSAQSPQTGPLPGEWRGTISLPNGELEFIAVLAREGTSFRGVVDIPAQGARGLTMGAPALTPDGFTFTLQGVPGTPTFTGPVSGDGKSVSGFFSQGGARFPFRMSWSREASLPPPPEPLEVVNGERLTGTWQGTLNAGALSLRAVFRITTADGKTSATFASPDQGPGQRPVARVGFKDGKVRLEMPDIGAAYAGTLSDDGKTIVGTFTQGDAVPLTLARSDAN